MYLIIVKPFKEKRELILNLIDEILIFCSIVAAFILACLDLAKNYSNIQFRMNLGYAIILGMIALVGKVLIF